MNSLTSSISFARVISADGARPRLKRFANFLWVEPRNRSHPGKNDPALF